MMAHLEKLFVSEGLPGRPYHTLDSRVSYKSETATAEMKQEVRQTIPVKKEFHPITTEIHVTELRPIKLDPFGKRGASESHNPSGSSTNKMWERRLQSESGLTDIRPQVPEDHSYGTEYRSESHTSSSQTHSSSKTTQRTENVVNVSNPELQSNMTRTVTSRTGSYSGSSPGSSPSATLSPPSVRRREKLTAEFKRRDVSPDFKMSEQKVTLVEGKCTCCPYGYHVDVDFMNYCDTMSNQSYLKQLQRIQREKRKLRKSMEVYLQDQERTEGQTEIVNPMQNHTHYQESTTNKILDEIDTSVDQTLSSIETMMKYSDTGTATVNQGKPKFNTFPKKVGRQVAQELQSYNETFTATLNNHDRADSNSSLSSISTVASERVFPYSQGHSTTETMTTRMTNITSQQLAETMATHLPMEDGAASPQSNTTNISKQSLHAIREAMAVSLQRMKDLEEQAKAIPVLQVRISVLKEEKRLQSLQMQAQNQNQKKTVSRGVGDSTIDSPVTPTLSPRFDFSLKSPPPTAPKPKVKMAAVGDHNVLEPYLLQPDLSSSYTTQDNSTRVFERETIIIDRAQKQHAMYKPESSKPLTRSVGVGEGNVFDDSMHIHEKELRTVIIGQNAPTGKRNVGIECRVPTRDVGVSYNFDSFEKPATRTVGVTTETTALVTNVSFRSEEFTSALKNALSKSVSSKAIQVDSRPEYAHVGIQYATSMFDVRTVGVGDCSIDVEVRNPVARRSVSIEAYPDRMNRTTNTDYGWRMDAGTNTVSQYNETSWTQTEQLRTNNSFTNTDRSVNYDVTCQTDCKVFAATDQLRNMGTNTETKLSYSTGMNTILRPLSDIGTNTIKEKNTRNYGMNTDGQDVRNVGCSEDRIDSFVCDLDEKNEEEEYRFEEDGIETRTVYYETNADEEVSKKEKGYEKRREYSDNSYAVESSQKQRKKSEEEMDQNEEIVEERVWRTSGDGQFTVTTVTTKRVFGSDGVGNVVQETKTVSGGPEVLGADAAVIQKEVARGRRSSLQIYDTSTDSVMTGSTIKSSSSNSSGFSSTGIAGSSSTGSSAIETSGTQGRTAIARVLGQDIADKLVSENSTLETSENLSSNGGGLHSTADLLLNGEGLSDSGMSSSQMSSSSDHSTTYKTIVEDGSGSPKVTVIERRFRSEDGSPQREIYSRSYDSGLSSTGSSGSSSGSSELISKTISSSSSHFSDLESPSGTLKSIMKKSKSDPGEQKRGITFAETVTGGSRPRRFELNSEMKEACQNLATYLDDSTMIQTKQLNASLGVIQAEWFKVSSSKLADAHQVEDYLSCFNEICKRTLEYIVNLQDSNGNTAIHYAVSNCNFEIVNLLLDTGTCDLNKMNKAGYTAVIMATLASIVTQRQEEVVQRLFSMGNVNSKAAKDGQTALMFAVRQGRTEMVKMLLDTGADTNIQDDEGSTGLMCAAEHGHTEIIKMLLNTPGCDATISDNDGSTALSIAMEAGHKDAGVLLYAHVNFGPGTSPAVTKKTRKSSSSPLLSPP